MKPTTKDIARAAIESAYLMLEQHGMTADADKLSADLRSEVGIRGKTASAILLTPTGSAGPLAERIKTALEKGLGRPVQLTEKADKSLLGGAILEYGDARIDLSVRGALDDAALHLMSTGTN